MAELTGKEEHRLLSQNPPWSDGALSAELPVLRSRGESNVLEYMREFPSQARELGKEIAAFASSGGGTILLGVDDDGAISGLRHALNTEGRDELLRRVEGICHGMIKPSITPTVGFAVEDENVVLVIRVPKGSDPVYYSNGIPYLRHLTQARPAEPQEVIEIVKAWLDESSPSERFAASLAIWISDLLSYAEEVAEADEDQGDRLKELQRVYGHNALMIRDLAERAFPVDHGLSPQLRALADAAEEVADAPMALGENAEQELVELIDAACRHAKELKATWIDPIAPSLGALKEARHEFLVLRDRLSDLTRRARKLTASGRLQELLNDVHRVGRDLLQLAYFGLHQLPEAEISELRTFARRLHVYDTRIVDVGVEEDITSSLDEATQQLAALVSKVLSKLGSMSNP